VYIYIDLHRLTSFCRAVCRGGRFTSFYIVVHHFFDVFLGGFTSFNIVLRHLFELFVVGIEIVLHRFTSFFRGVSSVGGGGYLHSLTSFFPTVGCAELHRFT
jgi:hypothetical protein